MDFKGAELCLSEEHVLRVRISSALANFQVTSGVMSYACTSTRTGVNQSLQDPVCNLDYTKIFLVLSSCGNATAKS